MGVGQAVGGWGSGCWVEVTDALGSAHLAYFLAFALEAAPRIVGPEQTAWLNRLDLEHDNLRSAMDWALPDASRSEDGLRLATSLHSASVLASAAPAFRSGEKAVVATPSSPKPSPP